MRINFINSCFIGHSEINSEFYGFEVLFSKLDFGVHTSHYLLAILWHRVAGDIPVVNNLGSYHYTSSHSSASPFV